MIYNNWLVRKLRAYLRGNRESAARESGLSKDEESAGEDGLEACEREVDPFNPFPDAITIEIKDVCDLHSIAPRDVKRVVEEYLREAHAAGFRTVRIIHGKGIGVQRETVRKILSRTSFVLSFTDAPPEAGGWGATAAQLSRKND